VSFGDVTPEQKQEVEKFGLTMYSWDDFLKVVRYSFDALLIFLLLFSSKISLKCARVIADIAK